MWLHGGYRGRWGIGDASLRTEITFEGRSEGKRVDFYVLVASGTIMSKCIHSGFGKIDTNL